MLLSEIFEQLTYGELVDTVLGGNDIGSIPLEHYPAIISHINLGLSELYKRFHLEISQETIKLYDHIETYNLNYKYAQTNLTSTEPYKYIMDSVSKPFEDRVLKVLGVYDEYGNEYPLNDASEPLSVFTPTYSSIQIPVRTFETTVFVKYIVDHYKIPTNTIDISNVEVNISQAYLQPLLYFVASRVFTNISGDKINEGNNYLAKFEAACKKLQDLNMHAQMKYITDIRKKGWV